MPSPAPNVAPDLPEEAIAEPPSRPSRRLVPSRRPARGFAIALVVAFVAGCGGDDGSDDTQPPAPEPLSKPEFLREADEICFSVESRIEAAADELVVGDQEPDPREVERVALEVVAPALESEVRAIRALGAPAGDERAVGAILRATEAGITAIRTDPRDLLNGVPVELRRAQRLAEAYGSRQCGVR